MTVLFQDGIPDLFLPALESRGCRIQRFPSDNAAAHRVFAACADAEVIFFRANFPFGAAEVKALPRLNLAALVSTGTDNLDTRPLTERGIKLVTGEGANAQAVFDYVVQALLFGGFIPGKHSVGVVGAGRVGGKVWQFMRSIGAEAEYYDPFKGFAGSLEKVLSCDFVTFHVPLTQAGEHPTAAMLDEQYFKMTKKLIRIIQTCRGGIWEEKFYRSLAAGRVQLLAQDVYPQEPPAAADLMRAKFSTPHIAGYSTRGRLDGILRGVQALFPDFEAAAIWPQGKPWFLDQESLDFSRRPGEFTAIRDGYSWRKEFSEYDGAEQAAFRARFPGVGDSFFEKLFAK